MEIFYSFLNNYNWPILSVFVLGILMSISPCPLTTNITAVAYISKKIKNSKHVLFSGLFYTLGRAITYILLSLIIYFGFSAFSLSSIFLKWVNIVLGPLLIIIALFMLGFIKTRLSFIKSNNWFFKWQKYLGQKGYLGSLILGVLFALAFCPYSGVLFFGILVPLVLQSGSPLLLPLFFSIGSALPVIVFALIIAFSFKLLAKTFRITQKLEKIVRYIVAFIFILSGLYYSQYLIKYLIN